MDREVQARLTWVKLFLETKDASLVCRRCGVSRPTLRKWAGRFKREGLEGLCSRSRRPTHSPATKVFGEQENWILALRKERKLGARRIQIELRRIHDCHLSLATIHKTLARSHAKPLQPLRRKKIYKRYSRPIPGERVQMDTCKIGPDLYQYTAIDDCTRYRVLGLYPERDAASTLLFLERVVEEMPFPVQRVQTDRGREFFAEKVQQCLMEWGIKFRPIKPGSPHLNGKVERSQKTDLQEFYPTVDLTSKELETRLDEWQHYYNWYRPHGSLNGKTPMDRFFEWIEKTPFSDQVDRAYDPTKERIQEANYRLDLELTRIEKLKRSM